MKIIIIKIIYFKGSILLVKLFSEVIIFVKLNLIPNDWRRTESLKIYQYISPTQNQKKINMSINYIYIVEINNFINTSNNKNSIHHFEWNIVLISLTVFLLVALILLGGSVNFAYSQNLSSSSSLKANAGEDQYVEEGQPVILNAEDSVSSRPPIDSYNWYQIEPRTPLVDLESNASRASFTSPNLPSDGYFVFQLIVKDQNITDTDTVNIYVVEDLASKSKEITGGGGYQPEQCFDGADNDLDGKIDLQDEECGTSSMQQFPNQAPRSPQSQSGGVPFNPNNPDGGSGQFPSQQEQPGQFLPGQGQLGQLPPGQISPQQGQ